MNKFSFIAILLLAMASTGIKANLWVDTPATQSSSSTGNGQITPDLALVPDLFRQVTLDDNQLETLLEPLNSGPEGTEITIKLPLPDGRLIDFLVWKSSIMEPALAAKYPELQSYAGQSVDDSGYNVRFDWTPNGFNAIILHGKETLFIAPMQRGQRTQHISYSDNNVAKPEWFEPESPAFSTANVIAQTSTPRASFTPGSELLIFRIAVAGSHIFTSNNGGTVALALAAIVTKINQVNAIYEREFSFRFILVSNNDQIIFTTVAGSTGTSTDDPGYVDSFSGGGSNFALNQTITDNAIGTENYDIGHLFLWNAGGGVVSGRACTNSKARGYTGAGVNLDVLLHEMGHQYSFPHTWNSTVCDVGSPGQYPVGNTYEPGSGTTVMSYAGLCGTDNVGTKLKQFHIVSFDQAIAHITAGGQGETCGQLFSIANNTQPSVSAGSTNLTFPISTPFVLTAATSDAEGDPLMHSWEEFDLGTAPAVPNDGEVPFFKVFPVVSEPTRTFPQIADVINGTPSLGEELPSTNQALTMRVHVYDNFAGSGGVNHAQMLLDFAASAGPFAVTAPNGAEVWAQGASETVTWNIASTNLAPILCSQIDIDLSSDGGLTYPFSLATGTSHDGTEAITVPNGINSSAVRVRVRCSLQRNTANTLDVTDHFFFDISDNNLTVQVTPPVGCVTSLLVQSIADSGACTLRDTIAAAVPGSTITFDAALTGATIVLATQLELNKNLVIDGGDRNITVSANSAGRVFYISSGVITLSRVTIADGFCRGACLINIDGGGGVYAGGNAEPTFDRVIFRNNEGTFGGAVYNDFADGIYQNCTFESNIASLGGGIYARNFSTTPPRVIIDQSTFKNNLANGNRGGAVFHDYRALAIRNSTFSGNTAFGNGGTIFSESTFGNSSAVLELTNVTITGSSATATSGNLHLSDNGGATPHLANITNTIIANSTGVAECFTNYTNVASAITETNNIVEDNTCGFAGGSDPVLGPLQSSGGYTETHALLAGSPAIDTGDNATCVGADINNVDQRGYGRDANCDIGAFEANGTAPVGAPAITLATFNVSENSTPGASVGTVNVTGGTNPLSFAIAGGNTGNTFAINASTGEITVNQTHSLDNQSNPQFQLLISVVDSGTPPLADSEIITINVDDFNYPPVISDQTFALSSFSPIGSLVGTVVGSDQDEDTLLYAITTGNTGDAFGINPLSGDISVTNNTGFGGDPTFVLTVQATDNGSPAKSDTATVTINVADCSVNVITSIADSGACTLRDTIAAAVPGSTITFDAALTGATIVLASEINLTKNLTIDGGGLNITVSGNNNDRVFLINSGINITMQQFTVADGRCRGACSSNIHRGAGIYIPYTGGSLGNLLFDRMIFRNNSGTFGGAMFNEVALAIFTQCLFEDNTGQEGAALYLRSFTAAPTASIKIDSSSFKNNVASNRGGAIYNDQGGYTVVNSTFSGNSSSAQGGAIQTINIGAGAGVNLSNVTIYNNSSNNGNSLHAENGAIADLINTIIANPINILGNDCINLASTVTDSGSNLIEDNTCGFSGGSDPVLGPLQSNGGYTETHALLAGSPAIDTGDNATCVGADINNVDQRGYGRGANCDIGAFEAAAVAPATPVWDGGGLTNNWSEAANWLDNTVPGASSDVIFNSTSNKDTIIDAAFAGTINSLTISDQHSGTITLARSLQVQATVTVGSNAILDLSTQVLTAETSFTNNGRLRQTQAVTVVDTTVAFFRITNLAANSEHYLGLNITPTTSTMGNVMVEMRGNQQNCTNNGNDQVIGRCFDITPTNAVAATLRFYFSEAERHGQLANQLNVWHLDSAQATWSTVGSNAQYSEIDFICVTEIGTACWAQVEGVTSYSPFTLGSSAAPSPVCTTSLSLLAEQWRQIGLSCNPGIYNKVRDILTGPEDGLLTADYRDRWVVYNWDEATASYGAPLTLDSIMEQGQGYWLYSRDAVNITVGSAHAPVPNYIIPLVSDPAGRFNMAAHPYLNSKNWQDVLINDGNSDLTLAQADPLNGAKRACDDPVDANCVVSSKLYKWNGGAYQTFDISTNPGTLDNFDGYWIKVFQPATLKIPAPTTTVPTATTVTPAAFADGITENVEWSIRLTAESGELRDPGNLFGVFTDSLKGKDHHDLEELSPFGSNYLTVVFPHPKWDQEAWGFTTDFRPATVDSGITDAANKPKRQKWNFEVRSGTPGQSVTLSWEGPKQILKRSRLIDLETGEKFKPNKQGSITFTVNETRRFRWKVKPF